ncbi:hypothetical protein N431DRAFT_241345 [Stipitochalara longipes BDJ]|nr:hypothetical protein N431DRAFT_241345 [Stipitochalara longipes BDJ]
MSLCPDSRLRRTSDLHIDNNGRCARHSRVTQISVRIPNQSQVHHNTIKLLAVLSTGDQEERMLEKFHHLDIHQKAPRGGVLDRRSVLCSTALYFQQSVNHGRCHGSAATASTWALVEAGCFEPFWSMEISSPAWSRKGCCGVLGFLSMSPVVSYWRLSSWDEVQPRKGRNWLKFTLRGKATIGLGSNQVSAP